MAYHGLSAARVPDANGFKAVISHYKLVMAVIAAALFLPVLPAHADQNSATVTITATASPITGVMVGGTNQTTTNMTGAEATPNMLANSISIDGTITAGTGYSVIRKNSTDVAGLLTVTLSQSNPRNGGQPVYSASWEFIAMPGPGGVDLTGLSLPQSVLTTILDAGPYVNGTQQTLTGRMYTSTGEVFSPAGLTVTAQFQTSPEPSGLVALGMGSLLLVAASKRMRRNRICRM